MRKKDKIDLDDLKLALHPPAHAPISNDLAWRFLYVNSLTAGVGSNDIGLRIDSAWRHSGIVEFPKTGNKVFLCHRINISEPILNNPDEGAVLSRMPLLNLSLGVLTVAQNSGGKFWWRMQLHFTCKHAHDVSGKLAQSRQWALQSD